VKQKPKAGEKDLNPIVILDLGSVILSFVVFYYAHQTQKSFGGLFKQAFAIFYSVGVLSLAIAFLEITGFLRPDASPSTLALHLFMFAILLFILFGLFSLSKSPSFSLLKQK
jgi:hypothetical protein